MKVKTYKTLKEVSQLIGVNTHVIRYWDSKFTGISTRLGNNKRRFFNDDNISKIKSIKDTLYKDGKSLYSLDLTNKLISKKGKLINNVKNSKNVNVDELVEISNNLKKIYKELS